MNKSGKFQSNLSKRAVRFVALVALINCALAQLFFIAAWAESPAQPMHPQKFSELITSENVPSLSDMEIAQNAQATRSCLNLEASAEVQERLSRGQVVVGIKDVGAYKFVVGRILINEPANMVWPILVNPFEMKSKVCTRMKDLKVLLDEPRQSILKCTIDVGFLLPDITYVVESSYTPCKRIEFHSVGGSLKRFNGVWQLIPWNGGQATELAYWMDIDPGYPVPMWLVREATKIELPKTLAAIRKRVDEFRDPLCQPVKDTIVAAGQEPKHL